MLTSFLDQGVDTRNLSQWDRISPNYYWSQFEIDSLRSPLLEVLDISVGDRIVEFGCGNGEVTKHLLSKGASVCCIDSSKGMLSELRSRLSLRFGCSCIHADFTQSRLCINEADWVIFCFSLEHQSSRCCMVSALRNAKSLLRSNGKSKILLLFPHPENQQRQRGDISRMPFEVMGAQSMRISLTTSYGSTLSFVQPVWEISDFYSVIDTAELNITERRELGYCFNEEDGLLPRYLLLVLE